MTVVSPTMLCGIIGHPLSHTLSPLLHNWGFIHFRLPGVYMAWDTPPAKLSRIIDAMRTLPIAGMSVTIPHKTAVLALADETTARARACGAANLLFWQNGSLIADNTDIEGFCAPLSSGPSPESALVLGTGGAARAVLAGLREMKVARVALCGRSVPAAKALAQEFGATPLAWENRGDYLATVKTDLVVNATPLGMKGPFAGTSALSETDFSQAAKKGIAYDLVYTPIETPFLQKAKNAGFSVQPGLAMLVWQGIAQFRRWTGKTIPFNEAFSLLRAQLDA